MHFDEILKTLRMLWGEKPLVVVLLGLGFTVFIFLVIDAWRHKRRSRRPR
jgi:hypothetical protein